MKGFSVRRNHFRPEDLIGRVIADSLLDPAGKTILKKGQRLQEKDLPLLREAAWDELHLVEMGSEEFDEEEAGGRLSRAVVGEGVEDLAAAHGKHTLKAKHKGLLRIEIEALHRLNTLPGIAIYTLFTNQIVAKGETVAHVQITPLAIHKETLLKAEQIGREVELIRVLPFSRLRAAVLIRERQEGAKERFLASLQVKLRWFECEIQEVVDLPDRPLEIRERAESCIKSGATLLLMAGSNPMDPLDPFLVALKMARGRIERQGIPAHPGTLLWLASLKQVPVIGLPSCGLFSHATVFDLLLPRLLALGALSSEEIASLGHGGILNRDMAFRFPSYEKEREKG
jgi:molybdopterin biosynthesis enzyme